MAAKKRSIDKLVESLQERAKELDCLYRIEEILGNPDESLEEVCNKIIREIPSGMQYPHICLVSIVLEDAFYSSPHFIATPWVISADIKTPAR